MMGLLTSKVVQAADPLEDSGLLGPVRLMSAH